VITTFERARLAPPANGSVISIGVFDGVHLGHRAILEANVATAVELAAMPTVVTFRRHPKRLLLGHAPRTLTTLEHRLELFERAGIEHAVVLNFDEALRDMSAAEFAREVCVEGLALRRLVLGFDSKLGRDREGTRSPCARWATTSTSCPRWSSADGPSRRPPSARRSSSATWTARRPCSVVP
jgi:FAD synthase